MRPLILAVLLAAPAAWAHFFLEAPASATNQSALGDPQKPATLADGCPAGTASGQVTQVTAGQMLTVRIRETVAHGGHYRVAFAQQESAFTYPNTVVTNNQCQSTTIMNPAALPVLADGLFVHSQAQATAANFCNGTATCSTQVQIPNVAPGMYILQVIEWMLPHSSAANNGAQGCFYAHCATLQVMGGGTAGGSGSAGGAGMAGGSATAGGTATAGGSATAGGTAGTAGGDGTAGGSSAGGSATAGGSSTGTGGAGAGVDEGGCACSGGGAGGGLALLLGLAALLKRRRSS